MSREIKFRAWNKEKKIMCYDNEDNSKEYLDGINTTEIGFINYRLSIPKDDSDWYYRSRYEVMQYTGLKDTNGKEIYEGDVVDYLGDIELVNSNVLRVIEYKNEEACFVARLPVGVEGEEAVYLNEHDFKVVGNIYEHSHLQEVQRD